MIPFKTFVVTWANMGFSAQFLGAWLCAFAIAYPVGVPVIDVMAPIARKITAKILGTPA